jgi:hypothetical protein
VRQLADLVEQQRAVRGGGDEARPVLDRAGEGAPAMTEQLALDERLGQRAAVDGDEPPAPARQRMQRARRDLLARAGLTAKQHRHVARCGARHEAVRARDVRRQRGELGRARDLERVAKERAARAPAKPQHRPTDDDEAPVIDRRLADHLAGDVGPIERAEILDLERIARSVDDGVPLGDARVRHAHPHLAVGTRRLELERRAAADHDDLARPERDGERARERRVSAQRDVEDVALELVTRRARGGVAQGAHRSIVAQARR